MYDRSKDGEKLIVKYLKKFAMFFNVFVDYLFSLTDIRNPTELSEIEILFSQLTNVQ